MSFTINYKGAKSGVVYNYKCLSCGHVHQEIHSMKDNPTVLCTNIHCCNSPCERVVLSAPALDGDFHYRCKTDNLE